MEKVKEFISYGIVGVMTTLVNYIVYFICLKIGIDWLTSNSLAWMVAVIFAYFSNRKVVFHSSNDMKKECIEFFGLRFMTLLVENLLLFVLFPFHHLTIKVYQKSPLIKVSFPPIWRNHYSAAPEFSSVASSSFSFIVFASISADSYAAR